MTASVIYLKNALVPQKRRIEHVKPCRIKSLAPQWDLPYIALLNGQAVLRKDWGRRIKHGDVLYFVDVNAIPQGGGGGGSNPLRVVLMIAVMVVAPQIAIGMGFAAGTMAYTMATMAIGMVGSMLVNALIPPPKPTAPQQMAALAAASPTYSLQAQGNQARLESAIPEHFGRHIAYPDFAAQPYVEYSGNEQYLYQLLCIGRGEYDIESINIEDTSIASFDDIAYEVLAPGQLPTMFPSAVVTSVEVSGQELTSGVWFGGFTANASGTTTATIGLDFVMPRGLYYAADDGSLSSLTINIRAERREINDVGTAIGDWVLLGTASYSAATTTAQRHSERYTVPAGRYEVRVQRTDTKNTSARAGHDVAWAGLRAYLPETRAFGDVTLIAMRMRASNNLSMQASRKINVIATRKLPIWNGSTWSAKTATRSIAWPIAYVCKQVGLTDAQIDLATLLALDAVWSTRGDYFDARFDNFLSFWEAVSKIAGAGRAKPYMQAGVMRIMRDQAQSVPVALFSMRNIIRGSFAVDYLMPTAETADAIDVGYFDADNWAPRRVRAKLPDSTAARPAKVELFGVTGRAQAHREGLYQAGCNRYRRKIVKFSTEMEGFIPSFGDLIAVQHDMPAWGQGGEVTAWDAGTRTATLSEPPVWGSGVHYMALRARDGSVAGPYVVIAGAAANQVVLAVSPAFTPYVGGAEERTHYAFGWAETWRQPARVVAVRPRGLYSVEIEAVNEDANVHTADSGVTMPAAQTSQLASYSSAPILNGLTVRSAPNQPEKMLLSWQPSPWADHYLIEQSSDGINWTRAGDVTATSFTAIAVYGADTKVRVAAVGVARGPWVQVGYGQQTAAEMAAAPPAAPVAIADDGMFSVHVSWDFGDARTDIRGTEIWWAAANDRTSAARLSFEPYPAQQYNHVGLAPGQGGYYWLRVMDLHANPSAWYPSGATAGLYASATASPDQLLTQLKSAVGMPQLAAELAAPIVSMPGAIHSQAVAAIQSALDDYDLTSRMQWQEAVTNATVTVDPVSGAIQLLATAAVTTDVEARLTAVEVVANADHGTLTSTVATLSSVAGDLTTAQSQITQLQNEVQLSASEVYVDNAIDGVAGVLTTSAANSLSALAAAEIQSALDLFDQAATARSNATSVALANETLQAHADAISAEATARSALVAVLANNVAAVVTETLTRASADASLASSISTLLARLDTGDYASVKTQASATANALGEVEAKWGVQVQTMADGKRALAGIQLLAGTDGESTFAILADKLLIYKPDGTGVPKQIVTLGQINGQTALGLDGNLIVDGSIVARSLAAKTITAASGVIDDAAIQTAHIGTAVVSDLHIIDGAVTLSAFASDNGYNRFWTAGSFSAATYDDEFSSVSFATKVGDDITVEAYCYFSTVNSSAALDSIYITPHLQVDGVDVCVGKRALWRVYDGSNHVAILLKAKISGTGSTRTAKLKVLYDHANFYNDALGKYRISQCVLSAFIRRR